jgi:cbb3-type cytochrome oxidase subunit 1
MAIRLLRIAAVYLLVGVVLGLAMGITHRFEYAPIHAHLVLLGWASLGLAGVVYALYPHAAQTRLARVHFWLHNLGFPVFMAGLFALRAGYAPTEPAVAGGAVTTFVGIAAFVANVLGSVGSAANARPRALGPSLSISSWK